MITFGIITDGTQDARVNIVVKNILVECVWCHPEVIVVGGKEPIISNYDDSRVVHIPFKEVTKDDGKGWITRKKNLITENAQHDTIVYMHDYIDLCKGWYKGFVDFCQMHEWDVCMNRINNADLTRYRDWAIWDDPAYKGFPQVALPPYTYNKTQFMYISGAYWIAKKHVMEDLPLNEELFWCEGEDVEWSKRMREKYKYVFNPYSQVKLLKQKDLNARRCY